MAELLCIESLRVGYGDGVVLDGLSLSVSDGEAVAVFGRNGVGKTTLMKTIIGLLKPASGHIHFVGGKITGRPAFTVARLGIGYVPQGRDVFADLTVEQNLITGNLAARDCGMAYDLFPILAEKRREQAGRLSGGQQQQLAIARALMGKPKMLLLDEPTEGVQPSVVEEITEVLAGIVARDHLALLLVEQNIEMALTLAARAVFIDHGTIIADTDSATLSREPELVEQYMGF
jgi:urea ABC transporter ATP-binding protein UrtE